MIYGSVVKNSLLPLSKSLCIRTGAGKNKQRNIAIKPGSLHDFVVLTINRNLCPSIASFSRTCGINRIQEINKSNSVHTKFEEHACIPVFFLSYPKAYCSPKPIKMLMLNQEKKSDKKTRETLFLQINASICGINKLQWPRCLRLLKRILNLEDVLKN